MMSGRDNPQQQFDDALDEFEASVETPFVPGEMERWIDAVQSTWKQLLPLLNLQIAIHHPEQYAQIQQEDEGLLRRVEQLRQEDLAIEAAATRLRRELPSIKAAIANVEPDEAQLKSLLDDFVENTTRLIIRIRTQQRAVRTWLMEAFTRDRGTVD